MSTKQCPNCQLTVPVEAVRCKECFHDFTQAPAQSKTGGLIAFLAMCVAMLAIGAGSFAYVQVSTKAERVVVDQETRSVVFTRKGVTGVDTDRIGFDQIARIEHVMGGDDYMFEVVAVAADGKRYRINQSAEGSLKGYAEQVAGIMDKPLEDISNVRGFGE